MFKKTSDALTTLMIKWKAARLAFKWPRIVVSWALLADLAIQEEVDRTKPVRYNVLELDSDDLATKEAWKQLAAGVPPVSSWLNKAK